MFKHSVHSIVLFRVLLSVWPICESLEHSVISSGRGNRIVCNNKYFARNRISIAKLIRSLIHLHVGESNQIWAEWPWSAIGRCLEDKNEDPTSLIVVQEKNEKNTRSPTPSRLKVWHQ